MLEGLDQIDWEGVGHHVYRDHNEIPKAIRDLLSNDPDVRDEAREFLLGGGQDFGDIYDTTHRIIPFLIEILGYPDSPGKADMLDHLSSTARHVRDADDTSVRMLRLYIKTYDALKAGLGTFLTLLNGDSASIRLAAISLLQYLTDEVEILIPEFIRRLRAEKEEEVQVALLGGLKLLMASLDWTRPELKQPHEPFLNELMETAPSQRLRIAAARTSVEIFENYTGRKRTLSPQVENLLFEEFWRISASIDYHGWSEEFDLAKMIIKDLVKLEAADHLLDMLQNPGITPVQAHLIAYGLLAIVMIYADDLYWNCRRNDDTKGRELDYIHSYPLTHTLKLYTEQRGHFARSIRLLEAIVESQKFWEIPTNMFSFFVGLPDTREQLRAILNSGERE